MADEWWNSSARTGDDEAVCSTAEPNDESAVCSTISMTFSQPSLPDAAAAAASSSSFLLTDRHMDYWTQDFVGGRGSSSVAEAATANFNTLLQLQGDAASHRLLLLGDDQQDAAPPRHPVPAAPYGDDGATAAPPQGLSRSPYETDNLQQYCSSGSYGDDDMARAAGTSSSTKLPFSQLLLKSSSAAPPSPAPEQFPGRVLGSPELFGPAMEPPQFLLQALEPRFLKSNFDVCSPPTRSAPDRESTVKKARIEAPSPLPIFKVRKEKLGDRITALQQLVSPFGKTDTASVLHEAIEYIKFLHDQVASLSSPYLRCGRPMQQQHSQGSNKAKDNSEAKQDLRSRGLCLVPVASTYTVASETATEFWHPTIGGTFR